MKYQIVFTKQAAKDYKKLAKSPLLNKVNAMLEELENNLLCEPKPKELVGDLKGLYSRRINLQHRLVYEIDEANQCVKTSRIWGHY